jgi:hypothetical protein
VKARYDKLVVVRAAASRMTSAAFANSALQLAAEKALSERLQGAAAALSVETGIATGAALAARNELSGRMQAAHGETFARIEDAQSAHNDVAYARRAARRALDAAVDIRRAHQQTAIARAVAKTVPFMPKGAG